MKSIRQIFKGNEHLMEHVVIKELIEYSQDLEDKIVDLKYKTNKSKENHIVQLLFDIRNSCSDILKRDEDNQRFNLGESFDYKECVTSLEDNINKFIEDYNIKL